MSTSLCYLTAGSRALPSQVIPLVKAKVYKIFGPDSEAAVKDELLYIPSSFLILSRNNNWKPVNDNDILKTIKAIDEAGQHVLKELNVEGHITMEFVGEIPIPKRIEILAVKSLLLESKIKKIKNEIESTKKNLNYSINEFMHKE